MGWIYSKYIYSSYLYMRCLPFQYLCLALFMLFFFSFVTSPSGEHDAFLWLFFVIIFSCCYIHVLFVSFFSYFNASTATSSTCTSCLSCMNIQLPTLLCLLNYNVSYVPWFCDRKACTFSRLLFSMKSQHGHWVSRMNVDG